MATELNVNDIKDTEIQPDGTTNDEQTNAITQSSIQNQTNEQRAQLKTKTLKEAQDIVDQRYTHRKWLIRGLLGFCTLSYLLFGHMFANVVFCNNQWLTYFIHSKHIMILVMALYLVPSIILAFMVKSIFSSQNKDELPIQDVISLVKS